MVEQHFDICMVRMKNSSFARPPRAAHRRPRRDPPSPLSMREPDHIIIMVRPSKRRLHLERLQQAKQARRQADDIDIELIDVAPHVEDDEFFFAENIDRDEELIQQRWDELIKWRPGAGNHIRCVYNKDSRTTLYRRKIENDKRIKSVADCRKIDSYFARAEEHAPGTSVNLVNRAIDKLETFNLESNNARKQSVTKEFSPFDRLRLLAVLRLLQGLRNDHRSKHRSSEMIANALFGTSGASYRARTIRDWSDYYVEHLELPLFSQGKFQKTKSLIDDEDVRFACRSYLRSLRADQRDALSFMTWVNGNLNTECGFNYRIDISERTARNWLHKLHFDYDEYRTGSSYVDGHERRDVVDYRNQFVTSMEEWQRRMEHYEGDQMEKVVSPALGANERKVVLVTQDESIFQAHDGKRIIWQEKTRKDLRPKGEGASIMVSGFLCPCHGLLRLTDDHVFSELECDRDSTVIINPGVNKDGYFTNEDLADQTNRMMRIFDILHPGCTALIAFDNSSNHHAMAKNALIASRLNLKDGGKNVNPIRAGWFVDDNGQRVVQKMQTNERKQKGLRTILEERSLFIPGMKLKECRTLLAQQPDFLEQKPLLVETVRAAHHEIIFYPKFHPEFNFIEMFWGACKAFARKRCDYSWTALKQIVPKALDSVSLASIRRLARKSDRYIDAYRIKEGGVRLTTAQVEHAVKQYKSHRSIPKSIMANL